MPTHKRKICAIWLSSLLLPLLVLHTPTLLAHEPDTLMLEAELQQQLYLLTLALIAVMVISSIAFYIYRVNKKLRHLLAELQRNETLQQDHNQILAMIASDQSLTNILAAIALSVEHFKPGSYCSILLLDRNSNTLNLGAAPSLPNSYNQAIADTPAIPGAGSCGTAAATKQRTIVSDIQTHPYWANHKHIAAAAGLAACWSEPILDAQGEVLGTFAIYHKHPCEPEPSDIKLIKDIARLAEIAIERNHAFDALKNSEARHRLLADNASDVIWTMDLNGRFTYVSPSVEKLRGFSVSEVMQQLPEQLFTETSAKVMREQLRFAVAQVGQGNSFPPYTGELEECHKDGSTVWTEVKTSGIYDALGQFIGVMGVTRDLTERKKTEDMMRYLAQHDPLTGLANRSLFSDRIDQAIKLASREQGSFALLLIDLNDFKPVNDQYGHAVGDELLCAIAQRLLESVRDSDTVSRLGGDEFTILLQGIHQRSEAEAVKSKILEQMKRPFKLDDVEIASSCCIGIAFYPDDGETEIELTQVADQQMYAQKRRLK
ncbi:diguanylate cyclase domain-containing protein [Nitrincola sp.]|uniref:sensor domain-containing diguanylate cyclase n=1 Tax=Nitrincola sp. TaxID=1926584 RepID=UPI003A915FBA